MATAVAALAAALVASILGPLVKALWIDPRVQTKQKMRDNFQVLLTHLEGFYQTSRDENKIREVCLQYRMAWLYTSDGVIKAINGWLKSQGIEPPSKGSVEWATALMVLQMRKEVYKKTALQEEDFLLVSPASMPKG